MVEISKNYSPSAKSVYMMVTLFREFDHLLRKPLEEIQKVRYQNPWISGKLYKKIFFHLETPESPGTPYKGAHRSN